MRHNRIATWALSLLVAVVGLGSAREAWGQEVNVGAPRAAGTAGEFTLALNAYAAEAEEGPTAALLGRDGIHRVCTSGGACTLFAPVSLPSGTVIMGIELDAIDSSSSGQVRMQLFRCPRGSAVCDAALVLAATDIADAPGPVQVRADLQTPHIVDNGDNTYLIGVVLAGSSVSIGQMRVFYRLQVSPSPGVATFGDVPVGHSQHQYIEALVASGITAGCGGGNYCPDAPLTRGQMAVFLSKGLGLHFAP